MKEGLDEREVELEVRDMATQYDLPKKVKAKNNENENCCNAGYQRRISPALCSFQALGMPRCPRCGKRCKTDAKVVRHLNQPGSSCAKLIDDLILISLPLQPQLPQVLPSDGKQDGTDIPVDSTYNDHYPTESGIDVEMTLDDSDKGPRQGSQYREDFTGAAEVYGTGKSFMGKFDSDGLAEQRKENLYYPFASKVDWEMASFLLRSRMSMAMIDDFLKLESVSTTQFECPESSLISISRLSLYLYLFELQRT